jgi:Putative adipose-regulatory protein (Seipin)
VKLELEMPESYVNQQIGMFYATIVSHLPYGRSYALFAQTLTLAERVQVTGISSSVMRIIGISQYSQQVIG